MFKSLRRYFTLWFVGLSAVIYLCVAIISVAHFHAGLTTALDQELQQLTAEVAHSIAVKDLEPTVPNWSHVVRAEYYRLLASFQIYDADGNFVQEHGPSLPHVLYSGTSEKIIDGASMRIICTPLITEGVKIGYVEVFFSTKLRDMATRQIQTTLILIAPLFLLAIFIVGFGVSGMAVSPIERTVLVLRRFMSDAGHELKTPISIIQVNAETLEQELEDQNISTERVKIIEETAERMSNLVNDISEITKLQNLQQKLPKEKVNLSKLLNSITDEFEPLFQENQIAFGHQIADNISVEASDESLRRVVSNLLQNALRYTDAGGRVHLSLTSKGKQAIISVEDTGIGIPEESLPHIFERFYRVEKSRSRAAGGSGLGLSMVKTIVTAYGGSITVESTLSKGSKFIVALPLSKA